MFLLASCVLTKNYELDNKHENRAQIKHVEIGELLEIPIKEGFSVTFNIRPLEKPFKYFKGNFYLDDQGTKIIPLTTGKIHFIIYLNPITKHWVDKDAYLISKNKRVGISDQEGEFKLFFAEFLDENQNADIDFFE